jgi:hypothetical protein
LSVDDFRAEVVRGVARGQRIAALFGVSSAENRVDLYAVLADAARSMLRVGRTALAADSYPALTTDCPQAHLFEREVAEQYGVRPEGHPWFKPVRFHASYRPGHDAWGRSAGEQPVVGVTDFYRVEGEEVAMTVEGGIVFVAKTGAIEVPFLAFRIDPGNPAGGCSDPAKGSQQRMKSVLAPDSGQALGRSAWRLSLFLSRFSWRADSVSARRLWSGRSRKFLRS